MSKELTKQDLADMANSLEEIAKSYGINLNGAIRISVSLHWFCHDWKTIFGKESAQRVRQLLTFEAERNKVTNDLYEIN